MARRGRRPGTPTMGASIEQTGPDTHRIRWSQVEDGKRRQVQTTIHGSPTEAEAYRAQVVHDKQTKGYHDPEEYRAKYAPPANLLEGLLAWADAGEKDELSASTVRLNKGLVRTVAEAIHEATGIPRTEPLPVTVLGRPLFDQLKPILGRRGVTVPRRALLALWNGWDWLAGDPASWPQVPRCPSSKRGYLPPGRLYGRTEAPTLAQCDAMLRYLRVQALRSDVLGLAVILRYTGLRVGQVQAIHREDIDLTAGTLYVRKGKSKREQAEARTIPLSCHLLAEPVFRALIEGASADARIVRVKNTKSIVTAWEAATAAGEVPRYTWDPPNRIYARPDQAFRAALQAHMTNERMPPDVVSHLVGHARTKDTSEKLREIHYGRSLEEHARAAVDELPPVNWTGPQVPDGVVRFEAHARTG